MVVLRGANPAMEGKPAPASTVNEHGRPITDLIRDELRSSDNGVVAYLFPKPGHTGALLEGLLCRPLRAMGLTVRCRRLRR